MVFSDLVKGIGFITVGTLLLLFGVLLLLKLVFVLVLLSGEARGVAGSTKRERRALTFRCLIVTRTAGRSKLW